MNTKETSAVIELVVKFCDNEAKFSMNPRN